MSGATPTLTEVITGAIQAALLDLHTALPGSILTYDHTTQTAVVQPGIKKRYKSNNDSGLSATLLALQNTKPLPPLPNIPVAWYASSTSHIHFPLTPGTTGIILFTERSLEKWLAGNGILPVDPQDPRHHHLSDAVFLPILHVTSKAFSVNSALNMELKHGLMTVELTPLGGIKITGPVAEIVETISTFISNVMNLIIIDPVSGPLVLSPATLATIATDKLKIESFKV